MRDYSKISPQFWIGSTGKKLRKQGTDCQLVALYLMTCPTANMLGMYYLPKIIIAHECGLPIEGAMKGLQGAIEAGFCAYDEDAEVVWVYEMASYQIADRLEVKDLRCKGVQNEYDGVPDCVHLPHFYERYSAAFNMSKCRGFLPAIQAPCKPLASQEQEQEQEQEQKQEQKQEQENPLVELKPDPAEVREIFAYWQKVMNSPKSVLDDNRKNLIRKALEKYTPADVCKAIRGCSKTPHNMGDNDRKTKFNGLDLILRNAEKIDYFLNLDETTARSGCETIEQTNARIKAEVLGTAYDGNTIDMETLP